MQKNNLVFVLQIQFVKRGFTVGLCARASGHKMLTFYIMKEPSGSKVLSKLFMPENVLVTATKNRETLKEWIRKIWGTDEDDASTHSSHTQNY